MDEIKSFMCPAAVGAGKRFFPDRVEAGIGRRAPVPQQRGLSERGGIDCQHSASERGGLPGTSITSLGLSYTYEFRVPRNR
jgi:hypothetical protein